MKAKDAERLGYGVKRVEKPKSRAPVPSTPPPKVEVTINNDELAKAIRELASKNTGITIDVVKELIGENKDTTSKRVSSCEMEHEYDKYARPVKTRVIFHYENS